MFVRFRQTAYRLQLSLVETRRGDGKVRHEHIASLGSIALPMSIRDRLVFWQRLHERLARLANRVDTATQGKIMSAVHAQVPMVTPDEQRTVQLENAKVDAKQWSDISELHVATAEDYKGLAAKVANTITTAEAAAASSAANAKAAQERVERIERGENVEGGLGKPMTAEDVEAICIKAGWKREDFRRAILHADVGEDELRQAMPEIIKRHDRATDAVLRAILRKRRTASEQL
jgi:hypothetical protein